MTRNVWRPPPRQSRARWWLLYRLAPAMLLVTVAGLLLYAVMEPFFHPQVYRLFLWAAYPDTRIEAYASPAEELAAFPMRQADVLNAYGGKGPARDGSIATPAAVDALLDHLGRVEFDSRDVLIVSIRARALTVAGQVSLLCGDFDPADLPAACYPLARLLDRIRQCSAQTKLILWDDAPPALAARLGIFAECTPAQVRQLAGQTHDPTLWLMLSHAELEQSHRTTEKHGLAFAQFVEEGLQGPADHNGDGFIDLGELYAYVNGRLAAEMHDRWDGRSCQTPVLLWGGGPLVSDAAYPLLVPLPPRQLAHAAEAAAKAAHAPAAGAAASLAPAGSGTATAGAASPATVSSGDRSAESKAALNDVSQWLSATAPELLSRARSLCDQLASSAALRPVDRSPQLWRAIQQRLSLLEAAIQTADPPRSAAKTDDLRRLVSQLADLAKGQTPQRYQTVDLAVELAQGSQAVAPEGAVHSLAMAAQLARDGGPPLPEDLATIAPRLEASLARADRAEFQKWLTTLPAQCSQYVECRLARALAAQENLPWSALQLALRTCCTAETVAAQSLACGSWMVEPIQRADRLFLVGQRGLLDPVRTEDPSRALILLQQASVQYEQVAAWNRDLAATQQLADEILFRLPDALHDASVALADPATPADLSLSPLLHDLGETLELLDRPSAARLPELARFRRQLELARAKLPVPMSGSEHHAAAGEASHAEEILSVDPSQASAIPASPEQLRRLRHLASAYAAAIRLSLGNLADRDKPAQAVTAAATRVAAAGAGGDLWKACAELGEALRNFYQGLPGTIEQLCAENQDLTDPTQRAERIGKLRVAHRLLYWVHPWDVDRMEHAHPTQLLRRAERYNLLVAQQQRLAIALDDAPSIERHDLAQAAAVYRQAALAIPQQPPLPAVEPPLLEIASTARVALADKPDHELPLTVTNRHADPVDVWVTADYDPSLLEVSARDDAALYDAHPQRDQLTALRPTFRLAAGESRALWLQLRRRSSIGGETRVVTRAVSRSDEARHDLTAELPRRLSVDLVAEGLSGSWQASATGLVLYPFPNRITTYKLYLVNSSAQEKQVDLELLRMKNPTAAVLPQGEVNAATAEEYLAQVGVAGRLAKIAKLMVPSGGKRFAIPFGPEDADKPKAAAEGGEKSKAHAPEPAPAEKEKAPPLSTVLLARITDVATSRQALRTIELFTQRPGRYVRVALQYDPQRRRADILVRPVPLAVLPPDGVWIECAPDLPWAVETPHRQGATLRPSATEALLHMEVPPNAGSMFPILVNVDGFQRAFRFEVPAKVRSETAVPESNGARVRILEPKAGMAYGPLVNELSVALAVDVPHGQLLDGTNCVEVGYDTHRDLDLAHSQSLRLTSDRQVDLLLDQAGADGTFAIRTRVSDLRLTLPAPQLRSLRTDLIARVGPPGNEVWSDPVELIFDDEGPQMSRLHVASGSTVVQGNPLDLSVLASDRDLSGVAKVEAAFDVQRRGEFAAEPPPVPGSLEPDGRWTVKIPTVPITPGVYTVLVRATDRVGNASEYLKTTVEVLSKEAVAARVPTANQIAGQVVYGRFEKRPVDDAEVRLVSKADQKARNAATDEQGRFTFGQVVPGEYTLTAEKLIAGNRRTRKIDIKVPPPPELVKPVVLILDAPR